MVLHIEAIKVKALNGKLKSHRYYVISDDRSVELNIINDDAFLFHMRHFNLPDESIGKLMSILYKEGSIDLRVA